MPKYRVTLDNGNRFDVDLDRPPESMDQLRQIVQEQIDKGAPFGATAAPSPAATERPTDLTTLAGASPTLRFLGRGALPLVGAALGTVAGGAVGGPTAFGVPAAVLVGEAGGSALGEYAAQRLFGEEPSGTQVGLAALAPVGGRVVGGTVAAGRAGLATRLPGAAAGRHELAIQGARTGFGALGPPLESERFYSLVDQMNPGIKIANLSEAVDEIISAQTALSAGNRNREVLAVARGLRRDIDAAGGQELPFQKLRAELVGIKDKIAGARPSPQRQRAATEYGDLNDLASSVYQDFEAAAATAPEGGTVRGLLLAGNKARRIEGATDKLRDILETKAITTRADGLVQINPRPITEALKNDKFLRESLGADDLAAIQQFAEDLGKLPRLPPPKGTFAGSSERVLAAGIGGTIGGMVGHPGLGASAAVTTAGLLSRALMTEPGRLLIARLMERGPFLDAPRLSLLAAFVRGGLAGSGLFPEGSLGAGTEGSPR